MGKNKSKSNKGKKVSVGKTVKPEPVKSKKSKSKAKVQKVVEVEPQVTSQESESEEIIMKPLEPVNVQDDDSDDSVPAILENEVESDSDDQDDQAVASQEDESQDDDNQEEDEEEDSETSGAEPAQKIPNFKQSQQAKKETTRSSDSENPPSARVFVANLSRASTDESVSSFFMDNGLPTSDVYLPKNNNVHKGFAFAEFKDVHVATRAVALSGNELDGSSITICFAKPRRTEQGSGYGGGNDRGDSADSNILFVKNLGPDTTQEILQGHFKNAQEIRVMTDDDGNCRGHAYVEYSSSQEAKSAKDTMVGHKIEGSQIFVDFAKPRGSNPRGGGSSFRGRGNSFGGRGGGFNRDRGGGRGGYKDRGGFNRGGGNFSRGRGNFQGRGGGSRGRGFDNRPRGNKIQFHDDD